MHDGLHPGPSGTFELGGAQFEFTTTIRQHPSVATLWVTGLHWPGCCECEGTHAPIGFGNGRFGEKFNLANTDFWRSVGIEVAVVECELNSWLGAGDLPDWLTGPAA